MYIRSLTEADLHDVAVVHVEAFPDSALSHFGTEAIHRYYSWQLNTALKSCCIGAFENSNLVGFCFSGVFQNSEIGFLKHNKKYLLLYLIMHPKLLSKEIVWNRIKYSIHIMENIRNNQKRIKISTSPRIEKFGILSIAVSPSSQGCGIGKLLIMEVEKFARKSNFISMRLSVHPENCVATRLYENQGWKKTPDISGKWTGGMEKFLQ